MRRLLVLWGVLVFLAGFAILTARAVSEEGFSAFSAVSLFILVLIAVGVIGALRNPPS